MFSTFDLCLLLYVIRLAGWLKHCNLSLSLEVCRQLSLLKSADRCLSVSVSQGHALAPLVVIEALASRPHVFSSALQSFLRVVSSDQHA